MIDEADYAPTTAVEAAHYVNCQKLAETLRETAAVIEFCRALGTTPAEAVVVGLGDDPWDQASYTIEQLEEIGCRLLLGPSEEDPIATQLSESSTFNTNETHAYDVLLRRQVLGAELETLGLGKLYTWFWSHASALPQQTRLAADGCLIIKEFSCTSAPAFNSDEEVTDQGVILHARFRVTVGDVEGVKAMPAVLQFTIKKKGLENFRKSDMQKAGRAGMQLAGELFHKLAKPRKFGPNAQQRYRLRYRDPAYRLRKRKRQTVGGPNGGFSRAIGEDKPFVFSGVTRRLAMAGNKVVARAPTAERHFADVIINAPALNFKSWVREEFERVNKDELKELQKAASKRYERELTKNGKPVTRRTKK